jgi:adenylyltransferase/sulfurtransferase
VFAFGRQARVGGAKAASASAAVRALNSGVRVVTHPAVTPANAAVLVASYDCVLDCTDNAASRYLLSDAAAAARVPLVSGAAVGTEGQLTVLCGPCADPETAAPCYRCLFPTPAPPAHCARCADAGVLGPVPGLIGTLQAVEAIKLLTRAGEPLRGRMLLYDALSARPFYVTRTRPRDAGCAACGEEGKRLEALRGEALCAYNYAAFVAGAAQAAPEVVRPPLRRVTVAAYAAVAAAGGAHLLVDVRPRHMCVTHITDAHTHAHADATPRRFEAAALRGAHSLPYDSAAAFADAFTQRFPDYARRDADADADGDADADAGSDAPLRVFLICRRGNKSQARAAPACECVMRRMCGYAAHDVHADLALMCGMLVLHSHTRAGCGGGAGGRGRAARRGGHRGRRDGVARAGGPLLSAVMAHATSQRCIITPLVLGRQRAPFTQQGNTPCCHFYAFQRECRSDVHFRWSS